jgi:RND family efflux transporter MFP subunit
MNLPMKLQQLPKKAWLPLAVLTGSLLASTALVALRPQPKPRAIESTLPLVEVVVAEPRAQRMIVHAQGTLTPRDEIELVAEVSGRVVWLSPSFDGAGEFAAGEALVRIAADDYEIAASRAQAAVARAESQLALARGAQERTRALFEAGAISPAAHEQALGNVQVAEANLRDARASLAQADLALARTAVRAPFAGRVRERKVSLGQYLAASTPVAKVYGARGAEVQLSVRAEDAAFLELPDEPGAAGPRVLLRGEVGGLPRSFEARVVGSSGGLDPRTRMLSLTARLASSAAAEGAALAIGAFVDAEIEGREVADLVKLPRAALAGDGEVVVVGKDGALEARPVEVYRRGDESVWIASGLAAGERVCARAPSALAPGTRVGVEALASAEASSFTVSETTPP